MMKKFSLIYGLMHDYPSYLIFFVTARCNSKCRLCFYWKEIEKAKSKKELTIEEIEKITLKFKTLPYLSLGGGEPFLRDDVDTICCLFYKNCNTSFINIPTNAILTLRIKDKVESILSKCPKAKLNIDLSLDGVGKIHDKIRGVQGNFERVIDTYRELNKLRKRFKNLSINILTVLSKYNQNNIIELIDYVRKNLNVEDHRLGLARIDSREEDAKNVSIQKYREYVDYLNKTKKKKKGLTSRILRGVYETSADIAYRTRKSNKMLFRCIAGKKLIIMSEEGNIYPCELLDKKIGNIRDYEYDIGKLLTSENSKRVRRFIKEKKCFCTWECGIMNSLFFNPKFYPKIVKKALTFK